MGLVGLATAQHEHGQIPALLDQLERCRVVSARAFFQELVNFPQIDGRLAAEPHQVRTDCLGGLVAHVWAVNGP